MKVKIEPVSTTITPVSYTAMLHKEGVYRLAGTGLEKVRVISFGDDVNALYVVNDEVEILNKSAWKSEMFLPLPVTEALSITFFGAGK